MPFWNRGLGLDPAATPEFTHTPGQVAFSPGGSQLLVTTKANTNAVDVFAIDHFGGPSKSPVVNAKDGAVPFAAAFDRACTVDAAVSGDGHRRQLTGRSAAHLRRTGRTTEPACRPGPRRRHLIERTPRRKC